MRQNLILLLYLTLFLVSCSSSETTFTSWQRFTGRDDGKTLERFFIYRGQVPLSWQRKDALIDESIYDTKIPLTEFQIIEGERNIRLTIHNFPYSSLEHRIPPLAQIERWKRQFESLDPLSIKMEPVSHGGYAGLFIQTKGLVDGVEVALLAWAMQLPPTHFRAFSDSKEDYQRRSDYTIKVTGPVDLIEKHQLEIELFANSFELIDEIPYSL